MRKPGWLITALACLPLLSACGEAPSSLLRQGQLPLMDFPLYLTHDDPSLGGVVRRYNRDRSSDVVVQGLDDPRGIAADRFNNLYVVCQGTTNKLYKYRSDGTKVAEWGPFQKPSLVALDSFDQPYISDDTSKSIIRVDGNKVMRVFSDIPSALAFGVDDLLLTGLFTAKEVYWGSGSAAPKTTMFGPPNNIALDPSGRVYIADAGTNDPNNADGRIIRYNQQKPEGAEVVSTGLNAPKGIAVDSSENVFVAVSTPAGGKIVLATHDGALYFWVDNINGPEYLTFSRY